MYLPYTNLIGVKAWLSRVGKSPSVLQKVGN